MSELLEELNQSIDRDKGKYSRIAKAWNGDSPAAYMSKKSRDALDDRLRRLGVNFPRLVVNSKVDRLSVSGIVSRETGEADTVSWDQWQAAGLVSKSELVHTDYYLYGAAYVTVWGTETSRPTAVTGTPLSTAVHTDPATGQVQAGIRRLRTKDGTKAIVFTPDEAIIYTSKSPRLRAKRESLDRGVSTGKRVRYRPHCSVHSAAIVRGRSGHVCRGGHSRPDRRTSEDPR